MEAGGLVRVPLPQCGEDAGLNQNTHGGDGEVFRFH